MKLGLLMIFVSDLSDARDFYCGILGFPLVKETQDRLDFEIDGCKLTAFKCEKNAEIIDYSNMARSVFVFEVDNVAEKMRELRIRGVHFLHDEPAENEFGRYAAFGDPFGNVHEIFERK